MRTLIGMRIVLAGLLLAVAGEARGKPVPRQAAPAPAAEAAAAVPAKPAGEPAMEQAARPEQMDTLERQLTERLDARYEAMLRKAEERDGQLRNQMSLMLDTAAVVLAAVGAVIALLTVFGVRQVNQLRQEVKKTGALRVQIEASTSQHLVQTEAKIELLSAEVIGRSLTMQGFGLGEASWDPTTRSVRDKARMAQAVETLRKGYQELKKVGGPAEVLALNNLVFFGSFLDVELHDRDELLSQARSLRDLGRQHKNLNLGLTYCTVVFRYGSDTEKKEACDFVAEVAMSQHATDSERRAAEIMINQNCKMQR